MRNRRERTRGAGEDDIKGEGIDEEARRDAQVIWMTMRGKRQDMKVKVGDEGEKEDRVRSLGLG